MVDHSLIDQYFETGIFLRILRGISVRFEYTTIISYHNVQSTLVAKNVKIRYLWRNEKWGFWERRSEVLVFCRRVSEATGKLWLTIESNASYKKEGSA